MQEPLTEQHFNFDESEHAMPFITMPGVDGLVYVPDPEKLSDKKHPCQDCETCGHCSDTRCRLCLNAKNSKCGKKDKKTARK